MPSVIECVLAKREGFLARYRLAYLQSTCAQRGVQTDIRAAALREAAAMVELAAALLPESAVDATKCN